MQEHRRHHHGEGVPPWVYRMGRFGGGPMGGFGHRGRMRRGDVRWAVLAILQDGPKHGYEIIRGLEERSGGRWRPSPGSVYPTLQLLQDEGLLRGEDRDGKRVYELTDEGRAELKDREDRAGGAAPWDAGGFDPEPYAKLGQSLAAVAGAMRQVMSEGSGEQIQRAEEILRDARRQLYELLAQA